MPQWAAKLIANVTGCLFVVWGALNNQVASESRTHLGKRNQLCLKLFRTAKIDERP